MSDLERVYMFNGERVVLIGGAITTPELYQSFKESLAHSCDDGLVRRHGIVLGKSEDLLTPTDEWVPVGEPTTENVVRSLIFGWGRPS